MTVPLMDIRAQYAPLRADVDAAIAGVLDSGRFILGPHVAALEETVGERLGGRGCVGVANGTDALAIALQALDVGPGDEVITSPYTFYATAEAIARVGATPVFCDIEPVGFGIDPDAVGAAVTARTRVILPVHIFGQPADMTPILAVAERHGLAVLEDAAQAFGSADSGRQVGTMGDAAIFSFFPTKNFPGIGDGGLVVCREAALTARVRRLRFHGSTDKVTFEEVGYNSRLDEIQAAVIRVFYPHLDDWNARRARAAAMYEQSGLGEHVRLPAVRPGATHTYHLFMVRHDDRDGLRAALADAGVSSAVYYGVPLHLQPVFAHLGYGLGDLPVAEQCAATALALPMHPNLTREDAARVVGAATTAPAGAGSGTIR